MQNRYEKIFPGTIAVSGIMILLGVLLGDPREIPMGLYHIVTMQDLLITDYVSIGGVGAALVNSGLVMVLSICLIKVSKDPFNGFTMVEMGLMAGFSLFGKNILNIWPIILGTWLYAKYQKEPFSKHASVALLATSLAPLVSYMALGSIHASLPLGIFSGVIIGFILPSLSAYTYKVQNGMNLYNMGFACGLFAMMIVPILTAFGDHPDSAMYWATEYNRTFAIILSVICAVFILTGFFGTGTPFWAVWAGYRRLLSTTGRAPSDYLRMFGAGPVLVNTGVNGLIGMAYIFIVGGAAQRAHPGGYFYHHGFLRLWQARPEYHPRYGGHRPGGLRDALHPGLPRASAGGALWHHAGSHLRPLWLALWRFGGVYSLGPGASNRRSRGGAEPLQQRFLRRIDCHRSLSHGHGHRPPPQSQAAGPGLLRPV